METYQIAFTLAWIIFVMIFSSLALRSGMKYKRTKEWGYIKPPERFKHMYKDIANYFIWIGLMGPILVIVLLLAIRFMVKQ
ncbi:MAG: hypothetical protein JW825_00760 [Candidatus Methanofastidiosa archaeon]|nr:hypothetical protein [Candidatus Methanofastidiosa archaeon]